MLRTQGKVQQLHSLHGHEWLPETRVQPMLLPGPTSTSSPQLVDNVFLRTTRRVIAAAPATVLERKMEEVAATTTTTTTTTATSTTTTTTTTRIWRTSAIRHESAISGAPTGARLVLDVSTRTAWPLFASSIDWGSAGSSKAARISTLTKSITRSPCAGSLCAPRP
ncbi:unnamed protein product [Polarella glacialis]|uniref:Uncharacterized protein n=1 Tax=Polarella glacialis TaxID=89957 RepID=A0A813EHK4_POLGL|nr:unnamed protein product [Polarella glacialis]CAE8661854.1 unnamed protein product [Polarella glacialis]